MPSGQPILIIKVIPFSKIALVCEEEMSREDDSFMIFYNTIYLLIFYHHLWSLFYTENIILKNVQQMDSQKNTCYSEYFWPPVLLQDGLHVCQSVWFHFLHHNFDDVINLENDATQLEICERWIHINFWAPTPGGPQKIRIKCAFLLTMAGFIYIYIYIYIYI